MKYNNTTGAGTGDLITDSAGPTAPKLGNSSRKTFGNITLVALAVVLLGIARSSLRGDDDKESRGDDGKQSHPHWRQLVIDVAEDARTGVVNPSSALPKRGDTVITNGKIYPGGTIPAGNGFDIDTTGSIGTWVSRGTFNFDFSKAFTGGDPIISSTDHYLFGPAGALNVEDSLMSEGQDSFLNTTHRVVLGGTGIYRGTVGEVKVEVLGQNSTGFVNRRLTFQTRTRELGH